MKDGVQVSMVLQRVVSGRQRQFKRCFATIHNRSFNLCSSNAFSELAKKQKEGKVGWRSEEV